MMPFDIHALKTKRADPTKRIRVTLPAASKLLRCV
jgi:hypothetical protein